MADFRTHAVFGVGIGLVFLFLAFTLSLVEGADALALIFFGVFVGALLPDMDSDSGVPFHVVFGGLSLACGFFVWWFFFRQEPFLWTHITWLAGSIAFVWIGAGTLFKRFTRHRGMAHSIPASVLCGLSIFFLFVSVGLEEKEAFILGVSAMLGYVIHLVLDEIYSVIDFEGRRIDVKHSLGSALKLYSRSSKATLLMYGLLLFLVLGNRSRFEILWKDVWGAFS